MKRTTESRSVQQTLPSKKALPLVVSSVVCASLVAFGSAVAATPNSPFIQSTCNGDQVYVTGTTSNDDITVSRGGISRESGDKTRADHRLPRSGPVVIATGAGNDTVVVYDDIEVILCPGTGYDTIIAGNGRVEVDSDGDVEADLGHGHNELDIAGDAFLELGNGDNEIEVDLDAFIEIGNGNNVIEVHLDAEISGGGGNNSFDIWQDAWIDLGNASTGDDEFEIDGRAEINAGGGDDVIRTGSANDVIITGSGTDQVFAGPGHDRCDSTDGASAGADDTYSSCEIVNATISIYDWLGRG